MAHISTTILLHKNLKPTFKNSSENDKDEEIMKDIPTVDQVLPSITTLKQFLFENVN